MMVIAPQKAIGNIGASDLKERETGEFTRATRSLLSLSLCFLEV